MYIRIFDRPIGRDSSGEGRHSRQTRVGLATTTVLG